LKQDFNFFIGSNLTYLWISWNKQELFSGEKSLSANFILIYIGHGLLHVPIGL